MTCCETKDTCTSMQAGSRVAFCNSFDAYECEFGIKANPHEVPCPNDNCNQDACCRQATGEPLPEARPADVAPDRDVVQYKTRITGLMHSRMGSKFTALDAEIKPIFASAAGVSPGQVETRYDAGSVLVTATITAASPTQELAATKLPSAADIVSAVKKIDNVLKEARIPGTELAAAEPVGVKFVANSDDPLDVNNDPPPPPTPPPSPTPPPKEEEEEDDDETDATEENTTRSSDSYKYFSVQSLLCLTIWHFLP